MIMYLAQHIESHAPDILFLSETKRRKLIYMRSDLGDENVAYRAVQIRSTESHRGGLIAMIRLELQLETAENLRLHVEDEFAQGIILVDKLNRAYIGWYSSSLMSRKVFGETLQRLFKEYDTQFVAGDFNARDPRWCTNHERYRRGAELLRLTHDLPQLLIHAPPTPSLMALKNKATGALRTCTVDLVLSRVPVPHLPQVDGYVQVCSDHHAIAFKKSSKIDRQAVPRRVIKTLLQSDRLRKEISTLYEVALASPLGELEKLVLKAEAEHNGEEEAQVRAAFKVAKHALPTYGQLSRNGEDGALACM